MNKQSNNSKAVKNNDQDKSKLSDGLLDFPFTQDDELVLCAKGLIEKKKQEDNKKLDQNQAHAKEDKNTPGISTQLFELLQTNSREGSQKSYETPQLGSQLLQEDEHSQNALEKETLCISTQNNEKSFLKKYIEVPEFSQFDLEDHYLTNTQQETEQSTEDFEEPQQEEDPLLVQILARLKQDRDYIMVTSLDNLEILKVQISNIDEVLDFYLEELLIVQKKKERHLINLEQFLKSIMQSLQAMFKSSSRFLS